MSVSSLLSTLFCRSLNILPQLISKRSYCVNLSYIDVQPDITFSTVKLKFPEITYIDWYLTVTFISLKKFQTVISM